jgi:hypothetical protein
MPARFNTELVDLLVAPGYSKFTAFTAPDLKATHPEATHWLTNHFLNGLLGPRFKNKYRQWAINQLFRAEVAFRDYHEACAITTDVLVKGRPDYPAIRTYFKAIARWESCLLNIQMFIDLVNKMKLELGDEPVFKDKDGSPDQRAYALANTIKHWGGDVAQLRHEEHQTIPVWLTNESLVSRSDNLTFAELAGIISEIATVADEIQNPRSFAQPL